ncbi:MAG TPA: metallophosphoesterase [Aquella sp.]|nr:metallophosphoesterase [Aquella sp.]
MKFIIVSDLHLSYLQPLNRTDCYFETCLSELRHIFEYARKNNIQYILCTGDVLDRPEEPNSLLIELIKLFQEFSDIEFITTVGNHDCLGNSIDTYKLHTLGILETALSNFRILVDNHFDIHIIKQEKLKVMRVRGFSYGLECTEQLLKGEYTDVNKLQLYDFGIALVHAQVGANDSMNRWQSIESQKCDWGDITAFGDIHEPFYTHQFKDGPLAVHSGAIGRRKINEKDIKPKFALLEVNEDFTHNVEFIEIPDNAKFAEKPQQELSDEHIAANFITEWSNIQASKDETPQEKVERISKACSYSVDATNLVMEILDQTQIGKDVV